VPALPARTTDIASANEASVREQALDEFLATADERFGPVSEEVLAEIQAMWPE